MSKPELIAFDVVELATHLVPGGGRPYAMAEGLQSRVHGIDADTGRYVLRIGASREGAFIGKSCVGSSHAVLQQE